MSGLIDTICFWLVKRRCAIVLAAHVANAVNRKQFDTDWLKGFCDLWHWRFEFARRIYKAQRLRITAAEARIAKKYLIYRFAKFRRGDLPKDCSGCRQTSLSGCVFARIFQSGATVK